MRLVVDASVAVKWFFADAPDEADSERALDLLRAASGGHCRLIQPMHFHAELGAVFARRQPKQAARNMSDLLQFSFVERHDSTAAQLRAVELAVTLGQHLFDTLYHSVALETGATLVTADRRYYARARHIGGIELLEDWQLA